MSGTVPVINSECMIVHVKEDESQFEWYRDNNFNYYRLKQFMLEMVFLYNRKLRPII